MAVFKVFLSAAAFFTLFGLFSPSFVSADAAADASDDLDDVEEDPKVVSMIQKLEELEESFDPTADSSAMEKPERKAWRQTKSDIKRLKEKIAKGAKAPENQKK